MDGMSVGFSAAFGRQGSGDSWSRLKMIDDSAGPARMVFEAADHCQRSAVVTRWVAILRPKPGEGRGTRVMWLLDGSTVRWPGGMPPGELSRGVTGLDTEAHPVLWFHASASRLARTGVRGKQTARRCRFRMRHLFTVPCALAMRGLRTLVKRVIAQWVFRVPGVFGAAGIVDAATVRVNRLPLSSWTRLRITVSTQMWDLSSESPDMAIDGPVTWPRLTIAAHGTPRPLDLAAIRQWL